MRRRLRLFLRLTSPIGTLWLIELELLAILAWEIYQRHKHHIH
jgi:hypothetical protein